MACDQQFNTWHATATLCPVTCKQLIKHAFTSHNTSWRLFLDSEAICLNGTVSVWTLGWYASRPVYLGSPVYYANEYLCDYFLWYFSGLKNSLVMAVYVYNANSNKEVTLSIVLYLTLSNVSLDVFVCNRFICSWCQIRNKGFKKRSHSIFV